MLEKCSDVMISLSNVMEFTCSVCRRNQMVESRMEITDDGNESAICCQILLHGGHNRETKCGGDNGSCYV